MPAESPDPATHTTPASPPGPPSAGWQRPGTLAEFRAELEAFPQLDPVERARRAPGLIEAAKTVLAGERGEAMAEAIAAGWGPTALARELGITRAKVYEALTRASGRPATAPPAPVPAHLNAALSTGRTIGEVEQQLAAMAAGDPRRDRLDAEHARLTRHRQEQLAAAHQAGVGWDTITFALSLHGQHADRDSNPG